MSIAIEGVVKITTSSLPNGQIGSAYSQTLAASGGTAPYTWTLVAGSGNLPAGLSLSSGGVISGTPTTIGTSSFTVQAADSESTPATATKLLSINIQGVVTITTSSLPNGAVNVAYSQTLAASGGTSPYTWSVTSGNLPNGLTLHSDTGVIDGTPTAPGTFPFTVQVADSESPKVTATANLSITIEQVMINNTALPSGIKKVQYNATLSASGGIPPYTWSLASGTLPDGLSLSSGGVISGSPSLIAQNQTFTVQAADSESPAVTAQAQLSITITTSVNNAALSGSYAFTFNGYLRNEAHPIYIAGSFVADGTGIITSGVLDENFASGPQTDVTFTGTYAINSNGLGTMTFNLVPSGQIVFSLAVNSTATATRGSLLLPGSPTAPQGSGTFKAQTLSGITLDQLVGNFASGFFGTDPQLARLAGAGAYTVSQKIGKVFVLLGNGNADVNDAGTLATYTTSSTPLTLNTTTGRGTTALIINNGAQTNWTFYVVSADEMIFFPADVLGSSPFIGLQSMLRQPKPPDNTYLNGASVVQSDGIVAGSPPSSTAELGLFTGDGAGNGKVVLDVNQAGTVGQQTFSGTYAVDLSGNGRVTLGSGFGNNPPILYLVNLNQAFLVGTDSSISSGYLEPQTGSPFTNASFTGSYWGGTETPVVASVTNSVSWLFPDGNGTAIGTNSSTGNLSFSYQIDNTGRGVVSNGVTAIFYVISPTKIALLPTSATDTNPALAVFTSN